MRGGSCHRVILLAWIAVAALIAGCERHTWEEGVRSTPITSPADIFARLIVGATLAATEDGGDSQRTQMHKLSCKRIGYASLDQNGEAFRLNSVSVRAPNQDEWCLQRADDQRVAFATHPWIKIQTSVSSPDEERLLNTFILAAVQIRVRPEQIEEAGSLATFAKTWVKSGSHIELADGEMIADFRLPSRFSLTDYALTDRVLSGLQCVGYEYSAEERQNPSFPQEVFILHAAGVLCPDPMASDRLIALNFSERYAQGHQINTVLFTYWRENAAEPFFNSMVARLDHAS